MRGRVHHWLSSLVSRPKVEHLEHPHGALAFAGGRTALIVRATGTGTLGSGANRREISGGFAGVLFVDVPNAIGRVAVEVPVRALVFRHARTILLDVIAAPPPAPAAPVPTPAPSLVAPTCSPALPTLSVRLEVPRP